MSSLENAACDDQTFLGSSWQGLRRPERSNSVQSYTNSSTQDSMWNIELLEPDSTYEPAVIASPPFASFSAPASRPNFVKANSYSEGVHDLDEMSHYLSSSVSSAHSHLQSATAPYSSRRRVQSRLLGQSKNPYVLQQRRPSYDQDLRLYSRPSLPYDAPVAFSDHTPQISQFDEYIDSRHTHGHNYGYENNQGVSVARANEQKHHPYLLSQRPEPNSCQHHQHQHQPQSQLQAQHHYQYQYQCEHDHDKHDEHDHDKHDEHDELDDPCQHQHQHEHQPRQNYHKQYQHQNHQHQSRSYHYQSHGEVTYASVQPTPQLLACNETSTYAPWQVTPTSSLSDIPRVDYFEDLSGSLNLDSSARFQSSGLDSSPPPAPTTTTSSAYFPDTIATAPDVAPELESESEAAVMEDNDGLEDRFYQSFNNPVQRISNSKHESVYEQLINDKPLMEALSKRVKRGYYRCAHCPKMFSSVLDYAKHIDEFEIQRDYKCPFVLCPWKILGLPRRPELRRHCAIQHKMEIPMELKASLKLGESDFPIMECPSPYCDKSFFRRDSYARHVAMVHEKADSRFNRRLNKVLSECPFAVGTQEHIDCVRAEMTKTKRRLKP
ncbi:LAME_0B02542g1_1 [Lachancea meyersii CBS 8951]|uniref:LAME_0B02542g1_1 n=1 Tax=Lachancea meyersii CBS 8951 TaxID=1266667 RepID=A0A1G4IU94_9SACH|nr:LAME_0B02542g1_1 [Lachancea meyersii CBS 8951]